jgi:glucosamine--fructose-6-phosphate aminotransferase (isomerizing)
MCGIVGYFGPRKAEDVLLDGLRRLEYRGYDSAGAAVLDGGVLRAAKAVGRVNVLADKLAGESLPGHIGIAHTRWATHGAPSDSNAHPHVDCTHGIAVVHNGIVENYEILKQGLEARGHKFASETDTEVIAHLIEEYAKNAPFEEAFFASLKDLRGTFGMAVVSVSDPNRLFAARRGSPLVIGLGRENDEFFLASDPAAVVGYTRDVIYLDDGEACIISARGVETFDIDHAPREKKPEHIEWSVEEIERGRFPHFMLKEIHEQPTVAANVVRGRLDIKEGRAVLGGLKGLDQRLRGIERVIIVGCGSAYYAGSIGANMIEEYAGIPAHAELASEFRYRCPALDARRDLVIAVSQSGETADTLGALREAKSKGVLTLGVVNVVGSTVARDTDAGIYTHAGPEIAVASTKAFLAQAITLGLITLYLGRQRNLSLADGQKFAAALVGLPELITHALGEAEHVEALSKKYAGYRDMLYLGRKYNAPLAFEGALKLKEVAYLHAEGYAAGEMKHGPIAMIDEHFPVLTIATQDSVYDKTRSAIEQVKARRAPTLAIGTEGDASLAKLADDVIWVPPTIEPLSPLVNAAALQLFAYYVAVAKGYDPDKPRNLAKSVTVE